MINSNKRLFNRYLEALEHLANLDFSQKTNWESNQNFQESLRSKILLFQKVIEKVKIFYGSFEGLQRIEVYPKVRKILELSDFYPRYNTVLKVYLEHVDSKERLQIFNQVLDSMKDEFLRDLMNKETKQLLANKVMEFGE
jgi:hypothetical protein